MKEIAEINLHSQVAVKLFFQIHTSLVNGRPGVDGPSELLQVSTLSCRLLFPSPHSPPGNHCVRIAGDFNSEMVSLSL